MQNRSANVVANSPEERPGARIAPRQQRSRERMERILAVATELISESGSDCMKMSEVADRTGISIGSLYQYFPDKRAIIAALADRYHEASRACIGEKLAEVATVEEFRRAFGELVDVYYELFLQKPAMRDIWSGTQSDKALLQIELLNSREDARLVAGVLGRLMPETEAAARAATAFLVMSLGEATMRLAISVQPEEARILVETYKRMALSELLADS